VPNFKIIGPCLTSLGSFLDNFVPKGSQRPKNEDFEKMKKIPPGIHPIYKCAKFQHDWVMFNFSRLPQSFNFVPKGSQGPKNEDFEKMKKIPLGITQSTSV